MFSDLPTDSALITTWTWADIVPYLNELEARTLTAETVIDWLSDYKRIWHIIEETYNRLYVATTIDTTDAVMIRRYEDYIEDVISPGREADQRLREKLLATGLEPAGFEVFLRAMRAEAEIFRQENVPLMMQDDKMDSEYNAIIGAQTIQWDGAERTIPQMRPYQMQADRAAREGAWRAAMTRQLADREPLNALWQRTLALRTQLAANADLPTYLDFRWRELGRFDYTPDDCHAFHNAIEKIVVPAAERLYEKRRRRLGVQTLRPWDTLVDPSGREALRPFTTADELIAITGQIFQRVDPQLGDYFQRMRQGGVLDLDNRKGKAPGGYCASYPLTRLPFIFMNSVGLHDDVQTLLHEGGHAFHDFERYALPLYQQADPPIEFCEVASMSMELLAQPYMMRDQGGFYAHIEDANRALIEHLEGMIEFWPYMAVVDAFQLWAYTHPADAANPDQCDAAWGGLWDRFMRGVDWSGLETEKVTGWHRKQHIFRNPLYYVEYGLAQIGAAQVWRNSLRDQAGAVAAYRAALALGGTKPLPALFAAAGARFGWDEPLMGEVIDLIETTLERIDP